MSEEIEVPSFVPAQKEEVKETPKKKGRPLGSKKNPQALLQVTGGFVYSQEIKEAEKFAKQYKPKRLTQARAKKSSATPIDIDKMVKTGELSARRKGVKTGRPSKKELERRALEAENPTAEQVGKGELSSILPAPTAVTNAEFDEQQVARCEALMLKGLRDMKRLTTLLGCPSIDITRSYVRRVYARWEITGSDGHMKRFRGEALHKLDLIETELWVTSQKTNDERTNVVVMQQLMALNKQRSELLGLTAESIAKIVTVTDEGNEIVARMDKQEKMVGMLSRFSELLLEGKNNQGMPLVEKSFPVPATEILPPAKNDFLEAVEESAKVLGNRK